MSQKSAQEEEDDVLTFSHSTSKGLSTVQQRLPKHFSKKSSLISSLFQAEKKSCGTFFHKKTRTGDTLATTTFTTHPEKIVILMPWVKCNDTGKTKEARAGTKFYDGLDLKQIA